MGNSKSFNQRFFTQKPVVEESMTPMSNFDLIDAASALAIKNFRGVFMRDQLPKQPKRVETGIINLDNSSGEGTHWVAYAIDPHGIVYFDSYGLAPPREFMRYITTKNHSIPIFEKIQKPINDVANNFFGVPATSKMTLSDIDMFVARQITLNPVVDIFLGGKYP